eukprot:Ihof_evm6s129 gene=Ihof_evmTU6s129
MSGKRQMEEEEDHPMPIKGQGKVDGDMGEFEDPFEDEYEEEDEVMEMDGEGNNDDTDMVEDVEEEEEEELRAYLPGDKLEEGEELEVDQEAYHLLHSINVEWPCLSFDIIPDMLGDNRDKYPMTAYVVAGTQADRPQNNKILVMKMSQMMKTMHDEDSEGDDSGDENNTDDDPILETRMIKTVGGVNRLRVNPMNPGIVASWNETGRVNMYDISSHVASLDTPLSEPPSSTTEPLFSFAGHATEGFSMDWSQVTPGRFASGDCKKHIYVWDPQEGGSWAINKVPFNGHEDSVEDIQWSPSEQNVFASCSVDKTIRIWDARKRQSPALTVTAHESDVNVISWNRVVNYLMVSGGDDGIIKIWDLRMFPSGNPDPVAAFKWHTAPITSVEWHPTEDSVLAVSGADDQTTLWDLSVEPDTEGGAESTLANVPPQLLFIHQ